MQKEEKVQELNINLTFNKEEVEEMSRGYFQYLIISFWSKHRDSMSQETFVELGMKYASTMIKNHGLNPLEEEIRAIIKEEIDFYEKSN